MATFPGGSAYSMVRDIAEGYLLVTERTYLRFAVAELDQISFELDRHMREVRSEQPPLDDQPALQKRNRKLQRMTSAVTILGNARARMRRAMPPPGPTKPGTKPGGSKPGGQG